MTLILLGVVLIGVIFLVILLAMCSTPLGSDIASVCLMYIAVIAFAFGLRCIISKLLFMGLALIVAALLCGVMSKLVYDLYSWKEHYFNEVW